LRVDFDYVKFKNIGSYGNTFTTIDFSKGVNLISATNGSGKSYIIEALVFCLTGKPYRKLKKIKNLINRTNKKDLYTEVGFHIGKSYWKVIRTLSPDTLEYAKREKDGSYTFMDSLSSKSLDQTEIEKILKIDPFMIKQIVALDVSYNKPFLSLTAAETRTILESVFNLSIFSKMLQEIKTILASLETDLKIDEKSLNYLSKDLENQQINLDSIYEMIKSFNVIKQQAVLKLQTKISKIDDEIIEHNENISEANLYLSENKPKSLDAIMISVKSKEKLISELRHEEKTKQERLTLLLNGQCPKCKTIFKDNFDLELEQTELQDSIDIIKRDINKINNEISDLEEKINKYNETNSEIKEISFMLKAELNNLNKLEEEKTNLEDSIREEENKEINYDIKAFEEKLVNTTLEEDILSTKIKKLTNK
jgi:DNA repair exonuclease SbcCD ATPase subunit